MAVNHRTSLPSRISELSAGQTAPALASFVVCQIGMNFPGSPVVSQLAIYQMAYEQAKITANQPQTRSSQNYSQN